MTVTEKLDALRRQMQAHGMQAYIVPTDDFHASEYVGDYFKVREYLSGFTGSAGTLIVLETEAALWTDGRYFLQAEAQLAGSGIVLMKSGEPDVPTIAEYLAEKLPAHAVIGFDGRTVSSRFVEKLAEKTDQKQMTFAGDADLADAFWQDRPPMSKEPVWELPVSYAGMSREEKLEKLREKMREQEADACLLTALDEIAWLLNLRGGDVAYTPVFLAYMLVGMETAVLCVHEEILSEELVQMLEMAGVVTAPYDAVEELLRGLPEETALLLDGAAVSYRLTSCVPEHVKKIEALSPVAYMKAVKTPQEMANERTAHRKDGVAVTHFIYWLKQQVGKERITELSAADKLEGLRAKQEGFLDQSFAPIVAYGAHGAIVHYEATEESDAVLEPRGFCLVDTGGHYREGTTDITRTIALGALTEEEKRAYTLVLRGHLKLYAARFPEGICGQNLDVLARMPLWENHMDYNHGTGHGVGYLLNVHEGPHRLHWRLRDGEKVIPLEEGMIVSDEPGLYLADQFGIRHENLLLVRKGEKSAYGQFLYFEALTMVPFDREAIDVSLLSERELALLNEYHELVYRTISPYFEGGEAAWLADATAPMRKE